MPSLRILHLEDSDSDRLLIAEALSATMDEPPHLTQVSRLQEALDLLGAERFDVILLDLQVPDSHSETTFAKTYASAPNTPILVLTQRDDDALGVGLVRAGAQDYLPKSDIGDGQLARSLCYAIERGAAQDVFRHLALHDNLTGLPNRQLFVERGRHLASLCRPGESFAVMVVKLAGLRTDAGVLDEYGTDELIKSVAQRLRATLGTRHTLARLDDREFAILAPGLSVGETSDAAAQLLLDQFALDFVVAYRGVSVTASIGGAFFPDDGESFDELLQAARSALGPVSGSRAPMSLSSSVASVPAIPLGLR